jgi:thioredoxin-like negative regulator of GroEL
MLERNIKSILLSLLVICLVNTKQIYDDKASNVINLNLKNFDTQITSNRSKNIVSLVHFYKSDDGKSRGLKAEVEKLAKDYDLMFKVGAIDCEGFRDICEKHDVKEFPTFKVFPPLPAPVFVYEGNVETSALVLYMGKFMNNKSIDINNNNHDNFVNDDVHLPKCFLFTDKKGVPLIYKALSVTFDVRLI